MPRIARILLEGGYYHILTRGNDRKQLFFSDKDYGVCLRHVRAYLKKFEVGVLHYCIMPNHMHFLIKVYNPLNVSKFMQGMLQKYAAYYRKEHNATGYVFQNRFKSLFIESEGYLLDCARYIERNPLRARLVNSLSQYKFSSFAFYTKGKDDGIITEHNKVYLGLAKDHHICRKMYSDFVINPRPYEELIEQKFRIS